MNNPEYKLEICPYFNNTKCEEDQTAKNIVDVCLEADYVNCDEFIRLERMALGFKRTGRK